MICNRCEKDAGDEFYANDNTCKECRKERVRANRKEKADYYREYDRKRFQDDPKVRARHVKYQATTAGKESLKKSRLKWLEANTVKRAAHILVGNAVRRGDLIKPLDCEDCGKSGIRINGHHDDYSKPLKVRWLCGKCHRDWHDFYSSIPF